MRVVWKEDNAHVIALSLEELIGNIELYLQQSQQVEEALREADPDGSNKQLKALSARFTAAIVQLKRISKDAEQLKDATNHMLHTFESCENEVIRILNELDSGHGAETIAGRDYGSYVSDRSGKTSQKLPVDFPKPRIAPEMRFSFLGKTMDWLEERMNRA